MKIVKTSRRFGWELNPFTAEWEFTLLDFRSSKEKQVRSMPRGGRKKKSVVVAKPVHGKGKKKRWEFNIVKTGNITGNYQSGNNVRSAPMDPRGAPRSRAIHFAAAPATALAPASNSGKRIQDQIVASDEVIGILSGNTSFESNVLQIQPGLTTIFPWLGQLALLYERYEFEELVFYYRPIVSGFASNGQKGKVILSCDYDAAAGTLTAYRQAETMDPHADGMPYETIELHLDPRRLSPGGKFIRRGPVPPGTDVKTYDAGSVYYSVSATTDSSDIGEIRVRYRVRLMNPRLPDAPTALPPNFTTARIQNIGSMALTALAVQSFTPFVITENGIGAGVSPGSNGIVLQQGRYLVVATFGFTITPGGGTVCTAFTGSLTDNVTVIRSSAQHQANLGTGAGDGFQFFQVSGYFVASSAAVTVFPVVQAFFGAGTTVTAQLTDFFVMLL